MILLSARVPRAGLVVGVVLLALALVGSLADGERFFRAYLVAYTYWLGLALGCLGIALIQFLTGGTWGLVTRRIFEAGAATLPLLAVLFLPLLFGIPALYLWAHPQEVAADPLLQHKAIYLNVPFFIVRAVVYFAAWVSLAELLRRWSRAQDRAPDPKLTRRLQRLSIAGLLILPLTASFAAIDWWMSLEPDWFSTMYPPMVCMGFLLLAMACAVLLMTRLAPREPFARLVDERLLNDLGSLLLAFLMLWAYMTYFQYMLIWAGNLKEEITWYVKRAEGGWMPIAWTLAGVGFLGPFWLLLFRGLKRDRRLLGAIASLLICMQLVVVYWLIEPAFAPDGPVLDWRLPVLWLGLGSLWLGAFAWRLQALPLLPLNDSRLAHLAAEAHGAAHAIA